MHSDDSLHINLRTHAVAAAVATVVVTAAATAAATTSAATAATAEALAPGCTLKRNGNNMFTKWHSSNQFCQIRTGCGA